MSGYRMKALLSPRNWRKIPHWLRRARHNLLYSLNDEVYWDEYARLWEKENKTRRLQYLGNEWAQQESFLSLLEQYARKDACALELGCGGGRITARGVELFQHVYAADVSKEMLRKCRESVRAPNVSFHKLDGFTLAEFADASVDFVYSHDVFVHFPALQVYSYLQEFKRVLKPGGLGLISFLHFVTQFEWFKQLSLDYFRQRRVPPHTRHYFVTEEMLRTMLADLSLGIREIRSEHYLAVVFQK